jgi:hypothetical protein
MQNVRAKQNFQNMVLVTDSVTVMTGGKWVNEKVRGSEGPS